MAIDWAPIEEAARQAAERAYCPYSKFRVGAAVLDGEGRIFPGCNIENASFGLTVCAERTAIFFALVVGARGLEALAVCCPDAAPNDPEEHRMPCGACRQVMAEFFALEALISVAGVGVFALRDLLPRPFVLTKASPG